MLIDVLQSTLDNGHACLHMATLTVAALLHDMEYGSLPCTMGLKANVKCSAHTRWVAMAPKAIKGAMGHSE